MPTDAAAPAHSQPSAALFIAAIGLSAALLFAIQPIYARMLLPLLGGAPAVWTTAMLFFQCALLAGYAYAHLLTRLLSPPWQAVAHGCVTVAAFAALPIAAPVGWRPDPQAGATAQTLAVLAAGVGAPFFALSANAPLLQKWFAASGARGAADPYFLYAASNAGSAAALLSYPLAIEPMIGVSGAALGWSVGYGLLTALLALCARMMVAGPRAAQATPRGPGAGTTPGLGRLAGWAAIAFVPSSLMLGVTQFVTTDVGAFPMLWIAPLGLYLLSFVTAFSASIRPGRRATAQRALLLGGGCLLLALAGPGAARLAWLTLTLMMAGVFAISYALHRRLYEDRPDEAGLTAFYLALSFGGALGGVFNAIIAPALFDSVIEFPLALAVAGVALARWTGAGALIRDMGAAALTVALFGAGVLAVGAGDAPLWFIATAAVAALGAVAGRPLAHAAVALTLVALAAKVHDGDAVAQARSFFGVYAVRDRVEADQRLLSHGSTVHGAQRLSERGGRPTPISYYHAEGPIGATLRRAPDDARIGVVGLGAGAVACHGRPGQRWTFFEIDPLVDRIARDPALFDYMPACAGDAPTVLGDARLTLADMPPGGFDLLLIDAYSSDAVPIHLLTVEAIALYMSRLAPDGALLLHLSNRHLDLAPIAARGAAAVGAVAALCRRKAPDRLAPGETASMAAALARDGRALEARIGSGCWTPLPTDGGRPWTDDAASLLDAL